MFSIGGVCLLSVRGVSVFYKGSVFTVCNGSFFSIRGVCLLCKGSVCFL